jgi:heptose-I-phosphate ethanolaminephosphotransferase
MNHPILKGLMFSAIPLVLYLVGMLNYSQAGQSGIMGFLILTSLFYWEVILGKRYRWLNTFIVFWVTALIFFMSFQMTLRDIFSIEQDQVQVIESIFNTNSSETSEFFIQYRYQISKHVIIFLLILGLYLFFIFKTPLKPKNTPKRQLIACCIFTLLALIIHFNPSARRSNPVLFLPIYYTKWHNELVKTQQLMAQMEKTIHIDQSAINLKDVDQKRTLVFVIGESDTRHDWSLFGYERETTPLLAQQKDLLAFNSVMAGDAGTIISITKMLTPATLAKPNLWKTKADVLSIAKAAGYKVFWLSNAGTDLRGVMSIFAYHADKTVFTNRGTSRGESSFDSELFQPYEEALDDPADKKFIILHLMGAHPTYNYRYPEAYAKYGVDTDDSITQQLKQAGRSNYAILFRNFYDNAVMYEDYFLSTLLDKLKEKQLPNSSWLYISDHGQDVSHHSDFSGHNHKAKEMWDVPMLYWQSPDFPANNLGVSPDLKFQADILDHTLLGLLNISGPFYDDKQDIFSPDYTEKYSMPRNFNPGKF